MTLKIQIVVDCKNPHELADWWAETLEWAVEPQDEVFIHSMIEQGFATEAETTTHRGKLVWREGAPVPACSCLLNKRFRTFRGLISAGTGCVGDRKLQCE